ncbi:multicopper oxidase domain-containing protein [Flavobacterium sp.]|uniref:multicopper oxidase domain-containing protein n=1 Tax=Flavobacterium sp. TaxID=239 RepID=UPI0037525445
MKKTLKLISLTLLLSVNICFCQYNALNIPEAYYGVSGTNGKTFTLNIDDNVKQYRTGQATVTGSINTGSTTTNNFWGPTMIVNKDDVVHMDVTNNLNESTTLHWHGMHLPAIMDGGPHQVIPAGTLWQPYWTIKNQAATLWYHPHLHETTQAQLTKGVGGFIIVKDAAEAALAIPRTYGIDDIPLAISSRRFLATTNEMASQVIDNYGDYSMINGTLNPQATLPKQWVRFRILNAEVQRGLNIGFSDNRTFYVIGNDGGLLNAPVAVTRMAVQTGERYEIMVNLSADTFGAETLFLKAYNTTAEITALTPGQNSFGWPGLEGNATTPTGGHGPINGGLLNNTSYNLLNIKIAATTSVTTPITAIPATLVNNTYWTAANVTSTRTITIGGGNGGSAFTLDGLLYSTTMTPKTVNLDAIEQWTIVNNNIFGHTFHLHDVFFKIISRSGGNMGTTLRTYEQGWKDSVWLPIGGSATFVAKFDDYSDATWPYMYHCHALTHEDEGMMGQFIVSNALSIKENVTPVSFSLYPNPATEKLYIKLENTENEIYYIKIITLEGRVAMMLPKPEWQNGIDISSLAAGTYVLKLTDDKTKSITNKKFIKK